MSKLCAIYVGWECVVDIYVHKLKTFKSEKYPQKKNVTSIEISVTVSGADS